MRSFVSLTASVLVAGLVLFTSGEVKAQPSLWALDVPGAAHAPSSMHLTDTKLALGGDDVPNQGAMDLGGGDGEGATGARPVLSFILGFFPGFGLGHLVAGSFGGFVGFLITDIVLLAVIVVLTAITPEIFYVIGWCAWIVEHIYEGIDAARSVSSVSMAEHANDKMMLATRGDTSPRAATTSDTSLMPAVSAMSFSF